MDGNNMIINIGRQFGSGGKQVALNIGSKLGIKVYDNELISKAAEESGFSKELFERSDEKRSMFNISSFFSSERFVGNRNYVGDNERRHKGYSGKRFGDIRRTLLQLHPQGYEMP